MLIAKKKQNDVRALNAYLCVLRTELCEIIKSKFLEDFKDIYMHVLFVEIFIETLGPSRSINDSIIKQSLKIIISYSINY